MVETWVFSNLILNFSVRGQNEQKLHFILIKAYFFAYNGKNRGAIVIPAPTARKTCMDSQKTKIFKEICKMIYTEILQVRN